MDQVQALDIYCALIRIDWLSQHRSVPQRTINPLLRKELPLAESASTPALAERCKGARAQRHRERCVPNALKESHFQSARLCRPEPSCCSTERRCVGKGKPSSRKEPSDRV